VSRYLIRHCSGPAHFDGQKFQDKEDEEGGGDHGSVAGPGAFGEKAPGVSLVTAVLADYLTNFLILLHFCFKS